MTTLKELPIEEAPRDFQALVKLGKYQLRSVANRLGLLESEKAKMDYVSASQEAQAQVVFEGLKEYDKTKGGAPKEPKTEEAKPKRQPRTSDDKPAAAATGPNNAEVLAAIAATEKRLLEALDGLQKTLQVMMSLTLIASEESLSASRPEILAMAVEDAPMIAKMLSGK